jgi:hypothetical protein
MICQNPARGTPGNSDRRLVRILAWGAEFLVQSPVRGTSPRSRNFKSPSLEWGVANSSPFMSLPVCVTERDGSDHAEAPAIIYLSLLPDRA